jgi:hypothetical protein
LWQPPNRFLFLAGFWCKIRKISLAKAISSLVFVLTTASPATGAHLSWRTVPGGAVVARLLHRELAVFSLFFVPTA